LKESSIKSKENQENRAGVSNKTKAIKRPTSIKSHNQSLNGR